MSSSRVAKKGRAGAWQCYGGDEPRKIVTFSELTRRTASLLPTEAGAPPTALLGGFNMHRVKRVHPGLDTAAKLDALGRKLRGVGLDVCTGLGYTAIASSRKPAVSEVVTIELDEAMVEIQRANPWSELLFEPSSKIRRLLGEATTLLPQLPAASFDFVIHDPPANALAGELYSLQVTN